MKNIIENTLQILSKNRPIFHSEADFQFALAWELKIQNSNLDIRMERPYIDFKRDTMISDIIIIDSSKKYAIELKYVTKKFSIEINKEKYNLKSHAATNLRRYDFYRDINRLETLVFNKKIEEGYAIFLTNDLSYLKDTKGMSKEFIFSDKHIINIGEYKFSEDLNEESIGRNRRNPIRINNTYNCIWNEYSKNNLLKCDMKYILITIS